MTQPGYVLMKRGLYWGPNYSGYVGALAMAGRYTEAEARARIDPDSKPAVTMHRVEDCPEFSAACWPETQIEILRRERDELRAQLAALEGDRPAPGLGSEVKFTGRHVPGRDRACASIAVGGADIDAWGEDHEEARVALVEQLERRIAEAKDALNIARATIAPEPSHDR